MSTAYTPVRLTPNEAVLLESIRDRFRNGMMSMSIQSLAGDVGVSIRTCNWLGTSLRRKGLIEFDGTKRATLRLVLGLDVATDRKPLFPKLLKDDE